MKYGNRVIVNDEFYNNIEGIILEKRLIAVPYKIYFNKTVNEYLVLTLGIQHKVWIKEKFLTKVEK